MCSKSSISPTSIIAAAAAHQWEAAEDHFQTALQQAEALPHRLEQAEIRRFNAMMLMDRAAPGDRERARALLSQARESYTRIGMPRHVEMTQALPRLAGAEKPISADEGTLVLHWK